MQREARLPGAARPGEREKPCLLEELGDPPHVVVATDERGTLEREVRRARFVGADRREIARESLDDDVVQVLRVVDVLQQVGAEVAELHAVRKRALHEGTCRVGDEDLAAVSQRGDPGGAMDVDADVVVTTQPALPGMESHPHADRRFLRPPFGCKAALRVHGGVDRSRRGRECREEGVAFGPHDGSVSVVDRAAEDLVVTVQQAAEPLGSERLNETRGALDVGEQERDRPGRECLHRPGC